MQRACASASIAARPFEQTVAVAEVAEAERAAELERRIDLLAAEIETLRTGGASDEPSLAGEKGLAPAAWFTSRCHSRICSASSCRT